MLYGELWKLSKLEFTQTQYAYFKERAKEFELPLAEALLDASFYDENAFRKIKSYEDFKCIGIKGLLNTNKSQIEIWYGGRKIKKLCVADLSDCTTLFPLYNTRHEVFSYSSMQSGIYVEQKEIGMVGCYECLAEGFVFRDLEFSMVEIQKNDFTFKFLKEIKYQDKLLPQKRRIDTLVSWQYGFKHILLWPDNIIHLRTKPKLSHNGKLLL